MNNKTLHKTRLLLTAWYVLITFCVSVLFSLFIYVGISSQLQQVSKMMKYRKENPQVFLQMPQPPFPEPNISSTQNNIGVVLLSVNIFIVFIATGAGYILAGKSLKPVQKMMEEQHRFISDASHELRAPLTALRTELEVATMKENINEETKKILQSNLEEVLHLQDLSNDLLELNEYKQNKSSKPFVKSSLLDITEQAIDQIIPQAKKKHITIDNQIQDIQISGDKTSLIRLLVILFDNAVKYSMEETRVTLRSRTENKKIDIEVTDQGIGMNTLQTKHIFDRFYRGDPSRSRHDVQGYGLGLSIAKQIVEFHTGSITVQSQVGKGSTFTVSLRLV